MSAARQKVLTWVAVPDDGRAVRTVTWHATREPIQLDGMSSVVSPERILTLCRETVVRYRISRTAQLLPEISNDHCCMRCVVRAALPRTARRSIVQSHDQGPKDHVAVGWDADHAFRWIEAGRLRVEEDDKGAIVLARIVAFGGPSSKDPVELYGPTWLSANELAALSQHLVGWFSDDLADKLGEIEAHAKRVRGKLEAWNDRARIDEEHPPYDDLTRSLDALLARCRELREAPVFGRGVDG